MSLATPEAFEENPSRSWAFYEYRRRKAMKAQPNEAHLALAEFYYPNKRKKSAPNCKTYSFITQNVDGLSGRALASVNKDKKPEDALILEMHGNVAEPYCTKCSKVIPNYTNGPIVPALSDIVEVVDTQGPEVDIPTFELPRCSDKECKGLMRLGVVWFGEVPRYLDETDGILRRTELLLVVGTSSTVYPAAGFAARVKRAGGQVAVFNLEPSSGDNAADFVFYGPCEETLPKALGV